MKKRILSLLIALLMIVSLIAPSSVQAATIKLNKSKVSLYEGKTYQLKLPGTKESIKWSSSNTAVATVNNNGKVTAIEAGYSYITAISESKEYTCRVTVKFHRKAAAKNVSFERYNTNNGIVTVVTNNNNSHVAVTDTVYFYNGNDIVGTQKKHIVFIAPNTSFAYIQYSPSEYTNYENTIKISKMGLKDMESHTELEETESGTQIDLRVKNDNQTNIVVEVAVLFYKDDKLIFLDYNNIFLEKKNSSTLISFFPPFNETPDNYKIYVQTYSNR